MTSKKIVAAERRTPGQLRVEDVAFPGDQQRTISGPLASPEFWDDEFVSFGGRFGSYGPLMFAEAPAMFALLVESQQCIGGDWRDRRDALLAKISEAR